ncbi:MAG: hypothetical protein P8188_13455 [Gemmatimonadota bacterium]
MIGVGWVLGPLPRLLSRDPVGQRAVRGVAAALLTVIAGFHVAVFQYRYAQQSVPLGTGRDRVLVDPVRAEALGRVVQDLDGTGLLPDESLLVLPEGIYLNYLVRRRSPTPVLNYMPIEMTLFDEDEVLGALQLRPPADVVWISKDIRSEYGVEFGESYARRIMQWLEAEYRPSDRYDGGEFAGRPFTVRRWTPR